MKRLFLAALLSSTTLGFSQGLENFLSASYNELFDLQLQKSKKDGDFDSLSWISPVTLSFKRTWDTQTPGSSNPFNTFSIGIEQPIFKSGGIYQAIKYAKNSARLSKLSVIKNRLSLQSSAIELALKIKETKLSLKKLKLQIKNSNIEIKSIKELYKAGLSDSVTLDNALVKQDDARIARLNLQATLETLRASFRKISDQNPDGVSIAKLRRLSKERFLSHNIDLDVANAQVAVAENVMKMKRSSYLPTLSVGARYTKVSKAAGGLRDAFTNYSLSVSMPLSVNVGNDLERSKLSSIIAKVQARNSVKAAVQDYKEAIKRVEITNRRIALARAETASYKRLLRSTRSLYKAGQKSRQDVEIIENFLKMKRLDVQIYTIERELILLKLHAKVR